ncbi:MAG: hemerythrin family protein [Clostridiales bacterium]|nr:hemerythrin family protein [Clostridiales bacterium]
MSSWKDSLLVGVPQIDSQHRKLVDTIDQLMDACMQGKGRTAIEQTLDFIVSYTKEHFKDEENLQAKYEYPGLAAHKQIHAQFITTVTALLREFDQIGPNISLTAKLNKTLIDWLANHISVEDKKVGEHILKAGGDLP